MAATSAGLKSESKFAGAGLPPDSLLFGKSLGMVEIRMRAEKFCRTNVPVLLLGDGGTGKETLGRWIHERSNCSGGEFVKVNCAAIPGSLLESELFGYEKGAFTGANQVKPGRVELAHGGTLFLDEIADLDMALQSKLLHFLQDGTFSRIGGSVELRVDARVICATNRNLEVEIAQGRFREDLFYRINVLQLRLPRLADRREDIPALAEYFRLQHEKQFGKHSEPLSQQMLSYLQNLEWPGNARELSNGIARYVLIGPEATISEEMTGRKRVGTTSSLLEHGEVVPLKRVAKDAIREMERQVILQSLRANQWNRRKTAKELKISYRALIYKIRDAGLVGRKSSNAAAETALPEIQGPQ